MGLDYIFPTNELLGNMVSADQPAMKTIFNVDNEYQLATENWLKTTLQIRTQLWIICQK